MITTLVSGPLLALAVVGGTDTVEQLRELCGPVDPEVATALRPGTYVVIVCERRLSVLLCVAAKKLPLRQCTMPSFRTTVILCYISRDHAPYFAV
jgi:hypothetical protein